MKLMEDNGCYSPIAYPFCSTKKLIRCKRNYELSNHLGNVHVVVADKKTSDCQYGLFLGYHAFIVTATDYYPFGMPMPGRTYTAPLPMFGPSEGSYRY